MREHGADASPAARVLSPLILCVTRLHHSACQWSQTQWTQSSYLILSQEDCCFVSAAPPVPTAVHWRQLLHSDPARAIGSRVTNRSCAACTHSNLAAVGIPAEVVEH